MENLERAISVQTENSNDLDKLLLRLVSEYFLNVDSC